MAKTSKQSAPEAPPAPVRLEAAEGEQRLILHGNVGVAHARQMHALALDAANGGGPVVVQAEGLQHVDAAAAQVLVALRETVLGKGGALRWVGVSPSVQHTLRNAGLAAQL